MQAGRQGDLLKALDVGRYKPNHCITSGAMRWAVFVFVLISALNVSAEKAESPSMQQAFLKLKACVENNRLDSAFLISDKLLAQLTQSKQLDSPFGLKVRLWYGTALEHQDLDSIALKVLYEVLEQSEASGQWATYAETCRVLASLYEKLSRAEQSLYFLRKAQQLIRREGLDSIYPRFAIRLSSWFRMFDSQDSAMFYAEEVLRTAPALGQVYEEAEGHLLAGLIKSRISYAEGVKHFEAALRGHKQISDYAGIIGRYTNLSAIHLLYNQPRLALAYNDSFLLTSPKALELGENNFVMLYHIYKIRGKIFQALGQMDSAIYYLTKGYDQQLEDAVFLRNEKVIEADNRYNVALREQELAEQRLLFDAERKLRYMASAGFLLMLLFAAALLYYMRQLRKASRQIAGQSEQFKSIDASKSKFFANVSHELRTPLTLLMGPIHTLLDEPALSRRQRQLLQLARQNGNTLQELINEILDLRKLEMGKMELNLQPVQLKPYVQSVLAQFDSLATFKRIGFTVELQGLQDSAALIDPAKCRQILNNLLSNAFKFTPAGGQVHATVELQGDDLIFSVRDNGQGIASEDLPHVFDRFFQSKRPEKAAEGGTGIGLALCREYARLMGGEIGVQSKHSETIFRVHFPAQRTEAATQPGIAAEAPEAAGITLLPAATATTITTNQPTILVVEDNPDLQAYIGIILGEAYRLIMAENGQAAWEMLTGEAALRPNLILSDLMMPIMDGYQLLEKLKSDDNTRHIPVIMLTARADASDRLKALRIGVDDYLNKPFDEEELQVRIHNLLQRQAARQPESADITPDAPGDIRITEEEQQWLESFETYMQQQFVNEKLSVSELAAVFSMSESSLLRQLKRLTGLTPVQYLQELRLQAARRLIEAGSFNSLAKVAAASGYSDVRSFSRAFKKRFGRLPSDW